MDRLRNIKPAEARHMLQLANRLHTTHDPVLRKENLLEGLCGLVHATAGSCILTHVDAASKRQLIISETRFGEVDPSRSAVVEPALPSARDAKGPATFNGVHTLVSGLQLADSAVSATLQLFRDASVANRFTARYQWLVDLFHFESIWIYQADVVLTSPNAMSLAPRARQTLELLLAGLGEKQIASKLRLSPNTVHHYVKSIHRHFGVSSRSELLARWVGR